MKMRRLEQGMFVAGQIRPEDIPAIAAEGVTLIVNNRPDGEEPGQPTGAGIEAAARAAGIDYRHLPVAGGFAAGQVAAMAELLAQADTTLAFCRSGTRSIFLWALAEASRDRDGEELAAIAAAAGYDLAPIGPLLG